jgi:PIN domain nuclease of toxin-antitoxin system
MELLLDTNALLWALAGDDRLGGATLHIRDRRNRVYASAVSAWEIAIKAGLGRLTLPPNIGTWLPSELAHAHFTPLPISIDHALGVERLPRHHSDPFDRLLIAQAIHETLAIVTSDALFDSYDVRVLRC